MVVLPNSLEPLRAYFDRAAELAVAHPFVAQYIRIFAAQLAMQTKGPDAGTFLLSLLDQLEADKARGIAPPLIKAPEPAPAVPAAAPSAPPAQDAAPAAAVDGEAGAGTADAAAGAAADGTEPSATDEPAAEAASQPSTTEPPAAEPSAAEPSPLAPSPPPPVKMVPATPQQAIRNLALDLYERGRQADKPGVYPSPAVQWSIVEAPKVAMCLHAAAVIMDSLKQFDPALPVDLLPFQKAAHARSKQLAGQLANALKTTPCIPLGWQPVDLSNVAATLAPPPPPPQPAAAAFPSVPSRLPIN